MAAAKLLVLVHASVALALDNGLGALPIMGYSTWNDLGCENVNAAAILRIADAMIEMGLDKLGYNYLNLDDCWCSARDRATGELIPDPKVFPDGIRPVIDYVHSKGLRFGLYTDRGEWTCGARPGSFDHELLDANTFAAWGVDYLKQDSCNAPTVPRDAIGQFVTMRDALNATRRPIFYALCGWSPWYAEVGMAIGNSWRVARDLNGYFELWNTIAINSELAAYAGPGAWNDPDALIGSGTGSRVHLQPHQSRTQFGLWAIMAAPLILGANLGQLVSYDYDTYTNTEVIAVDQDPLGKQGSIIWENCPRRLMRELVDVAEVSHYPMPPACQQIWGRPLQGGDWAVALVNWDPRPVEVRVRAQDLQTMGLPETVYVRDLWRKQDLGARLDGPSVTVLGAGGSEMYRLSSGVTMV